LLERLFARTVEQCWRAGLIGGDNVHVAASLIRADASLNCVVVVERTGAKLAETAVGAAEGEDPKDEPPKGDGSVNERHMVLTDADSTLVRHRIGKSVPSYKNHRALDDKTGVITALETTTGSVRPVAAANSRPQDLPEEAFVATFGDSVGDPRCVTPVIPFSLSIDQPFPNRGGVPSISTQFAVLAHLFRIFCSTKKSVSAWGAVVNS
jgi:hypothetical protein